MAAKSLSRQQIGWLAAVAAAGVIAIILVFSGVLYSPLFHPTLSARKAHFDQAVRSGQLDSNLERRFADEYWHRYPDVAASPYFGRDGLLGVFGAREHFDRFGRGEGRVWSGTELTQGRP